MLKGRDKDKCPIEKTREILGFYAILQEDPRVGKFPWSAKEFKRIAEDYKASHPTESSFELLDALVEDFIETETACGEDSITLGDFNQYLSEVSYSDFTSKNMGTVSIGTMHSAKGLEWDNVILALGSWVLKDADEKKAQENYRLLYVAATRAKKSLTIIGDEKMLPHEWISHFAKQGKVNSVKIPNVLHIETGLSDVNLGHLLENEKNRNRVRYIQSKLETSSLQSDVSVNFSQEFHNYNININGRLIAAFSNDFSKKCIAYLQRYGYKPTTANISQVVRWASDDGQETWVPLFRVEFSKVTSCDFRRE